MKYYYYYRFEDGYFCYVEGKMSRNEVHWEILKHGKLIEMRTVVAQLLQFTTIETVSKNVYQMQRNLFIQI